MMLVIQAWGQVEHSGIVERIETESGGDIVIDIPQDILHDILEQPQARPRSHGSERQGENSTRQTHVSNQGYRVQIFGDGRNPSTLRTRATARANAVCSRFPKYRGQVYSFSKAPNFYTRVGNFHTREEANSALAELRRAFPAFASEMRVVQSTVSTK